MTRALDFSAIRNPQEGMVHAILRLLSRRSGPMRSKEITKWFRGTPTQFVLWTLDSMVMNGQIRAGRTSLSRNRGVLQYCIRTEEN